MNIFCYIDRNIWTCYIIDSNKNVKGNDLEK